MKSNDTKIHVIPYPYDNVYNHPSIDYILKNYFPTLKSKVEKVLSVKTRNINEKVLYNELPKNIEITYLELKLNKLKLKNNLENLSEILWDKKPIVLIIDWCFTNKLLIKELQEILEDDFEKYVDIVAISYTDNSKNLHIKNKLYENSIVMLWWSYSDLEDIPESIFEWDLAKFIKEVHNNNINSKLIWICWWQQLISSIIWFDEKFSEKIISTYRWVAEFWNMPWELITSIEQVPFIYKNILNSITNNWNNNYIQYPLTRTWHVDFNLLNSYLLSSSSTITFIKDSITWSPIIWWTKNWNILWNQAHFEINKNRDSQILLQEIDYLINILKETYWNKIENILYNFDNNNKSPSLAKSFYTTSLLSFTDSIIKKNDFFSDKNGKVKNNKSSQELNNSINSQNKITNLISELNFWKKVNSDKLLENLDNKWFLRLSTFFDWKVNRWIEDVNDILWFNLEWLIKFHKSNTHNKWNYTFRDWWAWNWKLVNDIIKNTWINSYWVSDFAYFDIYESLIKLNNFSDIPKNLLKIFVQELIVNFNIINYGNVSEKLMKSLYLISMKPTKFKISSMFTDKTYRFNDNYEEITDDDKKFLEKNKNRINELKDYIKQNFYKIIIWYFDNVLISDFNSLYIWDNIIKKIDFQVAVRSTCHVDGKYLEKILQDYLKISSKPWSIYIDNWVVRSDSWVPRISEYINLEKNNKNIKIYFIYDSKTSYITSAIILNNPCIEKNKLETFLNDWYKLLTTEQIDSCSFFKIERFFRELMIFTFKNVKFSHDKNKEIISFLKELSFKINNLNIEWVKILIIEKINNLIDDINTEYLENYTKINQKDFDFYLSKVNNDIKKLFLNWEIENPSWFNQDFERK